MHWDGTSWAIVPSPNPSVSVGPTSVFNVLSATAAVSTADVWAVGYYSNGNAIETLVERYTVPLGVLDDERPVAGPAVGRVRTRVPPAGFIYFRLKISYTAPSVSETT
jgi:hypothetical protein